MYNYNDKIHFEVENIKLNVFYIDNFKDISQTQAKITPKIVLQLQV